MKKEYQYLIAGALVSAAVLLGMGVVGDEKQTTEGRYQFVPGTEIGGNNVSLSLFTLSSDPLGANGPTNKSLFLVIDSQTGTVNYVDVGGQAIVFPFATAKTGNATHP